MSKYGWDKSHNMIFVDQPIGVGFSYSDAPEDVVYDEHSAWMLRGICKRLARSLMPCDAIREPSVWSMRRNV